jgi:hypothetical protein
MAIELERISELDLQRALWTAYCCGRMDSMVRAGYPTFDELARRVGQDMSAIDIIVFEQIVGLAKVAA